MVKEHHFGSGRPPAPKTTSFEVSPRSPEESGILKTSAGNPGARPEGHRPLGIIASLMNQNATQRKRKTEEGPSEERRERSRKRRRLENLSKEDLGDRGDIILEEYQAVKKAVNRNMRKAGLQRRRKKAPLYRRLLFLVQHKNLLNNVRNHIQRLTGPGDSDGKRSPH